jgi:hypothetical protein
MKTSRRRELLVEDILRRTVPGIISVHKVGSRYWVEQPAAAGSGTKNLQVVVPKDSKKMCAEELAEYLIDQIKPNIHV